MRIRKRRCADHGRSCKLLLDPLRVLKSAESTSRARGAITGFRRHSHLQVDASHGDHLLWAIGRTSATRTASFTALAGSDFPAMTGVRDGSSTTASRDVVDRASVRKRRRPMPRWDNPHRFRPRAPASPTIMISDSGDKALKSEEASAIRFRCVNAKRQQRSTCGGQCLPRQNRTGRLSCTDPPSALAGWGVHGLTAKKTKLDGMHVGLSHEVQSELAILGGQAQLTATKARMETPGSTV